MKPIDEYPVSFGYKAQDGKYYGPNGSVGLYHRGEDRAAPSGTPINIGKTKIGEVGMTGAASGNHLHFQVMKNGTDINPAPYRFKGGRVTRNEYHAQFGNHIRIASPDGAEMIYAHLKNPSPIKVGTILSSGTIDTMTLEEKSIIFASLFNRPMNLEEKNKFGPMDNKTFAQTMFNNSANIRTIVYEKYPQLSATYEPISETLYRKKQ